MINYAALDRKYALKPSIKRSLGSFSQMLDGKGAFQVFMKIGLALLFGFVGLSLLITIIGAIGSMRTGGLAFLHGLFAVGVFLVVLIIPLYLIKRHGQWLLRLEEFCRENNFTFKQKLGVGQQNGIIFSKGHSKEAYNGIAGAVEGNDFMLFDYRYTTGSGKNKRTYRFGVVEIRLQKKFPHIMLDNKRDGSVGSFEFDRSQRLELEGNFNKFFNVYGPKEYEIEVLQILNPAVMQALLDIPEAVDVEITGDILYIYNKGTHNKRSVVESLFAAIELITASTRSVQKSFSMPTQIGDNRPVLKRSKWPAIITAIGILRYVAFQFSGAILRLVLD